jgi:hypothetical protein
MAKQTFTTGQVLTAAQMTSLQQTAMGGGSTTAKTTSYTLVAADAGTVVQMNSASATTITVNTALFAAGDSVQIQNIGAGVCTVTAGTATVNTAGSLALSQWEGGQLYFTATGASVFFDLVQSGAATTYTLLNSGGTALSGSSTTVSGITGQNKLFVYVAGASSTAASAYVLGYINNDTAANYRWFGLVSTNGAGATGDGSATGTELFFGQMGSSAANTISGSAFIDGANNTGIKPFTIGAKADGSSSNDSPMIQGFYVGTSTVSSIVIKTDAGSFDAGTVYVYGA